MSFNTIIKFFTPKDRIFYSLFEEAAENVTLMGSLITKVVRETDFDKRGIVIKQLEELEHKNDILTHKIFTELGKNFITPFDREDIHYLTIALDDICDHIYATAKKINFYKVDPSDDGIQQMAVLIEHGSVAIKQAVFELRNMKNINNITEAIKNVNTYENEADDVFDMCIERLFREENDIKELIKKREIYQIMELATDKFEDAANVIESIVIKYA